MESNIQILLSALELSNNEIIRLKNKIIKYKALAKKINTEIIPNTMWLNPHLDNEHKINWYPPSKYNKLLKYGKFDLTKLNNNVFIYSEDQVLKHIIDNAIDLHCSFCYDYNLIHKLLYYNRNLDIIKYVISKGFDIEQANIYGSRAIHFACETSSHDIIDYILGLGVEVNIRNSATCKYPIDYLDSNRSISLQEKEEITNKINKKALNVRT